jgi:hypothetical protein
MNEKEKKIKKLEDERRALVYEREFILSQKLHFLHGSRQTLLSIEADDTQKDKITRRIEQIESHTEGEMNEIRDAYRSRLKPVETELVSLYLDSFIDR